MTNITLICCAGMSTSMLVNKMKISAEKKGIDVDILAMPDSRFANSGRKTDILLLAPQASYLFDEMKEKYGPKGIKIAVIDRMDYGMMDGDKVLNEAMSLL